MEHKSSDNKKFNECTSKLNNCGSRNVIAETNNDKNNNSNMSDNHSESYITHESIDGVAQNSSHDAKWCSGGSLAALVPSMKNLELSPKPSKSSESDCLAGYVKAVIPPTGTVVIQLATASRILDVGTAIFVHEREDRAATATKEYREIGFISDIFGSVLEPMYSLQLKQRLAADSLRMDTEVFYMRNHPSTRYISVVREADDRYTVVQN